MSKLIMLLSILVLNLWPSLSSASPAAVGPRAASAPSDLPWVKYAGNPVLTKGPSNAWDSGSVSAASVLFGPNDYEMWYSGHPTGSTRYQIGYANSGDGVSWAKSGSNPVLSYGGPGSWDSYYVLAPYVLRDGSTYKMWYRGANNASSTGAGIGYATSPDGIAWTKPLNAPVLAPGVSGSWDESYLFSVSVLKEGGTYKMWYAGCDTGVCAIGYATSPNGTTWTKSPSNPVITLGPNGSWDARTIPYASVTSNGSGYEIWYSGANASFQFAIGHATSADGIAWTKDPANPVITTGATGSWDDLGILAPTVVIQPGGPKLWYAGNGDPSQYNIGLATAGTFTPTEFIFLPALLR
jgi:predicted GH43/DUF377 family glycosyl hydrolase